jgi:hypothetical protein
VRRPWPSGNQRKTGSADGTTVRRSLETGQFVRKGARAGPPSEFSSARGRSIRSESWSLVAAAVGRVDAINIAAAPILIKRRVNSSLESQTLPYNRCKRAMRSSISFRPFKLILLLWCLKVIERSSLPSSH